MSAVESLLREYGIPVGGQWCDVEVETRRDLDGDFHARYTATLRPFLSGVLDVEVQRLGIEAGADPDAWARLLVDEKLKPFQQKLERAAQAAAKAWAEEMDRA